MEEGVTQRDAREARTRWYKDWLVIPAILAVLGIDQLSKYLVRAFMEVGESFPQEGIARIHHTYNTGGGFGFFPNQTLFLIVASIVAIGVLLLVYRHHPFPGPGPLLRLSLGLQLGGALGNLLDRLRLGYVTDFVQLGWWPVFNVADASITVGIIVLVTLDLWPTVVPRLGRARRPLPATWSDPQLAGEKPVHTDDEPPGTDC